MDTMNIDCTTCPGRDVDCGGCVVALLLDPPSLTSSPAVVEAGDYTLEEVRALGVLWSAGLTDQPLPEAL